MAHTRTWNDAYEDIPAVGDDARDGAQRFQDFKEDIRERIALDHKFDPANADDTNDGFHDQVTLLERASASSSKANAGRIYSLDVSGVTELYYKDSGNAAVQITVGGKLNILAINNIFTKGQVITPKVLTPGTTVTPNCNDANLFTLIPEQNFTLSNPSNAVNGFVITIAIKQDGTGSRIITYGNKWKFPNGASSVLTTDASAIDSITAWFSFTLDVWLANISKKYA